MKIGFFSTKPYDRTYFDAANREAGHELSYFEAPLRAETAVLAGDAQAVCAFVNDTLDRAVLEKNSLIRGSGSSPCARPGLTMSIWKRPRHSASPWRGCRPIRPMRWPSIRWPSCLR